MDLTYWVSYIKGKLVTDNEKGSNLHLILCDYDEPVFSSKFSILIFYRDYMSYKAYEMRKTFAINRI